MFPAKLELLRETTGEKMPSLQALFLSGLPSGVEFGTGFGLFSGNETIFPNQCPEIKL